jgi:hypothetical protein
MDPHFHKKGSPEGQVSEVDLIPDGRTVNVVPDWAAPEGTEVTFYDGSNFSRYKMVDGTWRQIGGGAVAGNDMDIQFNDAGVLAGDDTFQWDETNKNLLLNNPGSSVAIIGSDGATGQVGTKIEIDAGSGGTNGNGADISINGGYGGSGNTNGGNIDNIPGDGSGSGNGGDHYLRGGQKGSSGNDGNVITGGTRSNPGQITPNSANGGFLVIHIINGAPTGTPSFVGSICFDFTNNKLDIWNGTAWKSVTLT